MTFNQAKVIIVGAGPTGMTAAMELARQGIPVRLIENTAEPATTSRAVGVQARTLELFEQRGMVDAMIARGNHGLAGSIYDGGKRMFRLEFNHIDSKYNYMLFISQAETEAILRDALTKQGVMIEREVELHAFSQSDRGDTVKTVLKHKDGSLESATYDYLIDAEGAHSIARTTLRLQFKGKTLDESYALGDLHIEGNLPETDFHIFSSEYGFMGLFPMGGGRFRTIASNPISKPSKDTAPSLEELQQIYNQRSHIPLRFHDMSWSSWFRINSRMIETLRAGRIFLGGDSAHIHSPAGAQGMNTGIQDMINLAWKLALVIKGEATHELLDTYSEERVPVIRNVLTKTEGLTSVIGSENRIFRSVFDHIAPWIASMEFVQENSTERMSQLSLNYRESPLSVADVRPGEIHAGDRIPDLVLMQLSKPGEDPHETQTNLFRLLTPDRFTLLYANITSPEKTHKQVQSLLSPWKHLVQGYQVSGARENEREFRHVFGTGPAILLIRPDSYVAFTGSQHSVPPLAEYLKQWFPTQPKSTTGRIEHARTYGLLELPLEGVDTDSHL
jgi:2-polyprenyl-6-methoxyphenol hydroxylase-like FAD-dependent oxidoreductase